MKIVKNEFVTWQRTNETSASVFSSFGYFRIVTFSETFQTKRLHKVQEKFPLWIYLKYSTNLQMFWVGSKYAEFRVPNSEFRIHSNQIISICFGRIQFFSSFKWTMECGVSFPLVKSLALSYLPLNKDIFSKHQNQILTLTLSYSNCSFFVKVESRHRNSIFIQMRTSIEYNETENAIGGIFHRSSYVRRGKSFNVFSTYAQFDII